MKGKYLKSLILIIGFIFISLGCMCSTTYAANKKINYKPKYIKFTEKTVKLGKGEKYKLTYTLPKNSKAKSLKFTSSNKKIATVSKTGKVTAKKKGTVKIKVRTNNGKKAKCKVIVKKAPQKGEFKITNKTTKVQKRSNIYKIKYTLKGAASHYKKFKSSNEKIAKVDSKGVVTGIAKGTVTITVKLYNGVSDKITLKVINDGCLSLNSNA